MSQRTQFASIRKKRGTLCNEMLDVYYENNEEYACGENAQFLVLNLFVYLHNTRL